MAVLTNGEKVRARRFMADLALAQGIPVTWVKGAVNDAALAIIDLLTGDAPIQPTEVDDTGTALPAIASARIDAATSTYGITFTAAQKKALAAVVFEVKFLRDR